MATLHMDVDTCTSTQSNIMSTKEQLAQQVTTLEQAINGMVGTAWIAPGATIFQSDFQTWRGTMNQLLEQLNTMGTRLQTEIAQWNETAAQG